MRGRYNAKIDLTYALLEFKWPIQLDVFLCWRIDVSFGHQRKIGYPP